MKRNLFYLSVFVVTGFFFSACMKTGSEYQRPEFGFQMPRTYAHETGDPLTAAGPPSAQTDDRWWECFGDPQISSLVEDALAHNPDIQKAAAVVVEYHARAIQSRSSRFPALDVSARAGRNQASMDATIPTVTTGGALEFQEIRQRVTTNSYALSIPAAFELDLWGRLARADEASRADLMQAEENRKTIIQSIIAEAVSLYLEMESLERRILLNENRIANLQTGLNLVEKRYAAGLTSALEVRQARRSLSRAKSLQPALLEAFGINRNKLAVVCGTYPGKFAPREQPEDYYHRLGPIPAGLPSDLLLRRPDIRAAEAGLAAQNARVGEARAYRFPMITLTANFGYASSELDRLIMPGNELWGLAAGILAPVFDAGKRKANEQISEARYAQKAAEYAKTVLNAFAEVENTLLMRKQQLDRRNQLISFLREARVTQNMAQLRYERGLVDYLTVLEAVLARFLAEEDLISSDLALLQNRVNFHRALGGGWPGKIVNRKS